MKKKPIQETIDKALDFGRAHQLNNKQIEYLIKAIAQEQFGDDANYKLTRFKMKITEDDEKGIAEAHEFMGNAFKEFLELGDNTKR
jgi:hypothetical protein